MLCLNISDITIITVKNIDYRCIMYNISKSEAINWLEHSVLEDREYISQNIVNFLLFLFSVYKIFDSIGTYKSLCINVGTVMKNPEILRFVPDHFKTKQMCN